MATDKRRFTFTYEGKRYSVFAYTEKEAGTLIAEKKAQLKNTALSHTRLGYWAVYCIDNYKVNCSEKTVKHLKWIADKCIVKVLGDRQLETITSADCQRCLNMCAGKSKGHIKYVHDTMRFIFHRAYLEGKIKKDPTDNLVKPKGTEGHRRALTPEERKAVLEVGKTERRYFVYLLMMLCGCRPSEAYECKGSDIVKIEGRPFLHIRGKKTALSDRFVPIPKDLYQLIRKTPVSAYISSTDANNKQGNNAKRAWEHFRYHLDLFLGAPTYRNAVLESKTDGLTPYCLRHEYCTELARRKIDIRTAQKLMGHSTINLTANIYTNLETRDIMLEEDKLFD